MGKREDKVKQNDRRENIMGYEEKTFGNCPCCGEQVVEKEKGYFCKERTCRFVLWKNNRFFQVLGKELTEEIVEKLLAEGNVKLTGCKSARTGNTYDCIVVMTVEEEKTNFHLEFENKKENEGSFFQKGEQ